MSLNNNLLKGKGLVQTSYNTRPGKINSAEEFNQKLNAKLMKESVNNSSSDSACPPGSSWSSKLKMCLSHENVKLLKSKGKQRCSTIDPKLISLKNSLIKYRERTKHDATENT